MRAIEALREVLRLRPDADDQRLRLARLLEETGSPSEAAAEYLELARRCQAQSRIEEATTHAETALRLDPNSREAKELIGALHETLAERRADRRHRPCAGRRERHRPSSRPGGDRRAALAAVRDRADHRAGAKAPGGRRHRRRDRSSMSARSTLGMERSDVFYSLGLLYQERGDHQRAVEVLMRAASDPEYALSAHYALGTSYQELGPAAAGRPGVRADHPPGRSPVDRQGRVRRPDPDVRERRADLHPAERYRPRRLALLDAGELPATASAGAKSAPTSSARRPRS